MSRSALNRKGFHDFSISWPVRIGPENTVFPWKSAAMNRKTEMPRELWDGSQDRLPSIHQREADFHTWQVWMKRPFEMAIKAEKGRAMPSEGRDQGIACGIKGDQPGYRSPPWRARKGHLSTLFRFKGVRISGGRRTFSGPPAVGSGRCTHIRPEIPVQGGTRHMSRTLNYNTAKSAISMACVFPDWR